MAGVRNKPLASGKYQGYYTITSGKQKYFIGSHDKAETIKMATELEDGIRLVKLSCGAVTVKVFCDEFFKVYDVSEHSLREAKRAARDFVLISGVQYLTEIERKHVEMFNRKIIEYGASEATAEKKIRYLKRIFNVAVRLGLMRRSPFDEPLTNDEEDLLANVVAVTKNIKWQRKIRKRRLRRAKRRLKVKRQIDELLSMEVDNE